MSPEALPDPIAVALAFAAILDSLGIPYLIGGSLASSVHGEPRSTNDIDIVADFRVAHVGPFVEAIRSDYYLDEKAVRDAVQSAGTFNAIHLTGAVKVDVFVAGQDDFEAERLRSRQRVQLSTDPAAHLFVDAPEYSVLRKLEWYRRGGEMSERQWRDVLGILRVQGTRLDEARLRMWGERLGVSDLLDRAVSAAR